MLLALTITLGEEDPIEESVTIRDAISYEDHFRTSFGKVFDAEGGSVAPMLSVVYRIAWITLRARHGERRDFDTWLEEAEPHVSLGHEEDAVPPTGPTSSPDDDDSHVSPSEEDSTPPSSSTSTTDSSQLSKQSSTSETDETPSAGESSKSS